MKNYGLKLIGLSGIFFILYLILIFFSEIRLNAGVFFGFIALFSFSSYLMHIALLKTVGRRPQEFVNKFMGITGLKLLIYLIALFSVVAVSDKSAVISIVVCFFILYISYTAFEVATLLSGLRDGHSGE